MADPVHNPITFYQSLSCLIKKIYLYHLAKLTSRIWKDEKALIYAASLIYFIKNRKTLFYDWI